MILNILVFRLIVNHQKVRSHKNQAGSSKTVQEQLLWVFDMEETSGKPHSQFVTKDSETTDTFVCNNTRVCNY